MLSFFSDIDYQRFFTPFIAAAFAAALGYIWSRFVFFRFILPSEGGVQSPISFLHFSYPEWLSGKILLFLR